MCSSFNRMAQRRQLTTHALVENRLGLNAPAPIETSGKKGISELIKQNNDEIRLNSFHHSIHLIN